jgi:H/ACA ribonucleoprotein complex subunit 3
MLHILKCPNCKSYGLKDKCSCGAIRAKPKPPKYSPEDKYGNYRRQFKEEHKESQ